MADNTARRSRRTIIGLVIVFALFIICAAALFLIFRPQSEDEPIPTPTSASVAAEGDKWEEIQARGKLVVGTAADYPPFEYYDENFQLNGLDIAIIEDIGRRLGLDVEIRDMAFDGLGNALQVNQIDLAISAISVTDERRRFVDFSNVYFVSTDAVLASSDSQIDSIAGPEEVAPLRIGVESGTVYDNWVQTELVGTGLMPADNAHAYRRIDDAIEDLSAGRIDLVALDLQPAKLAESRGDVKIVAQEITPQEFAMAVPKGAIQLLAQLNQALFDMQGDGTLRSLTAQHIGLDEEAIPPLPEPEPTPETPLTDLTPAFCIDSSEFVEHLSLDHQEFENIPEMMPGQPFQKGWRMRNTGTCTWGVGYALIPVDGNDPAARMGGLPIEIRDPVQPGQTHDFLTDLVTPIEPGTYVEYWSMRNNQSGLIFGDRVSVAVEVAVVPTPTPAPTQTPVPGISFSANPEVIQQGQCSTLTWNTSNVESVYLYAQGEDWRAHSVADDGTLTVCPISTTTYELRVALNNGSVEIRRVTVFVTPNPQVPQIIRFTVDPPDQIALGQCVTIQWIVEGQVDTINIFRNNVILWPNAPVSGARQDCPTNVGQQIYSLDAAGPGGTSRAQWVINVVQTSTAVPTSTPTVAAMTPTPSNVPVIYYFTVSPEQIRANNCVTLSWSVGGNATRVTIIKNSVTVQENLAFNSSWNDCSNSNVGTVIYILTAASDFNQTDAEQRPVNVLP